MEQILLIKYNHQREINAEYVLGNNPYLIFDSKDIIKEIINKQDYITYELINTSSNKLLNLYNYQHTKARIEPGAIIRENVSISDKAIILMGAVINTKASIGDNTMIDMNAVIGSGAQIKNNCHIGAGVVVAGIMEPISKKPVIIEDNVFIGANAVILEGIHIHKNAIIGAGTVVTKDIFENEVIYDLKTKIVKTRDEIDLEKVKLNKELRK